MRHKYLFLGGALLVLACVPWFQGCQIGRPDLLQEEIRKQPSEYQNGLQVVSATCVLKYIPLGTSIEQAKRFMESHDFRCSSENKDSPCYLIYTASKNAGFMMAEVILVTLDYEAGKITDVKVATYLDGP
jgi:hypothetical protein